MLRKPLWLTGGRGSDTGVNVASVCGTATDPADVAPRYRRYYQRYGGAVVDNIAIYTNSDAAAVSAWIFSIGKRANNFETVPAKRMSYSTNRDWIKVDCWGFEP